MDIRFRSGKPPVVKFSDKERASIVVVLDRKRNQEIVIGHNIRVTVVQIRGNNVRLGIEAPKEIPVHRAEVEQKIQLDPFSQ